MNLVQKVKKLAQNIDGLNIDSSMLQALDSDKLLKIYNVLTQLSTLVEANKPSEFNKYMIKELITQIKKEL